MAAIPRASIDHIADPRIVRLVDMAGNAVSLDRFVSMNTATTEIDSTAVIGGFGVGLRTANTGSPFLFAYEWDGNHTRGQLWGTNLVSTFGVGGIHPLTGGALTSDVLRATFDHPALSVAHEATISVGDSGGGWLLRHGDG